MDWDLQPGTPGGVQEIDIPVLSDLLDHFHHYTMFGEMLHGMGTIGVGKGPGVSEPSIAQVVKRHGIGKAGINPV